MSEIPRLNDKAQGWQKLVEEQSHSGKTLREFCEAHQVKRNIFYYWKQKFRGLAGKGLKSDGLSGRFISLKREVNSRLPRIYLPNGVQIELGEGLESGAVSQFIRELCEAGNARSE
jgi:hypothetical protein